MLLMAQISDHEIEEALGSLARIIERYGGSYWPIFKRLEDELQIHHERSERLARYSTMRENMTLAKFLRK